MFENASFIYILYFVVTYKLHTCSLDPSVFGSIFVLWWGMVRNISHGEPVQNKITKKLTRLIHGKEIIGCNMGQVFWIILKPPRSCLAE